VISRAARGRVGRPGGFTLLEVLIALAILGLAVVASIEGFAQGLRLLKLSGDHQQAMLLADRAAREALEPREGRAECEAPEPFACERVTRLLDTPELLEDGRPARVRVFEIAVRVSWDERRQVELTTMRTVAIAPDGTPVGAGAPPPTAPPPATSPPPGTPAPPGPRPAPPGPPGARR
jgi:prepilin-type N-terminal cleavage/methylation domain-containing protein